MSKPILLDSPVQQVTEESTMFITNQKKIKQVWQWPYEAPGIVDSGLYAITFRCGPKDMYLEKYILISQKNINTIAVYMNFYIE